MNTPLPLKSHKKAGSCDIRACRTRDDIHTIVYNGVSVKICARCRPLWEEALEALGEIPENLEQSADSAQTVPDYAAIKAETEPNSAIVPATAKCIIDGEPATAPDGRIAAVMRASTRSQAITLSYAREKIAAALEPVKAEVDASLAALKGFVIRSQSMLDTTCSLLVDTKGKDKAVEGSRTKLTRPILDLKSEVDGWFSPTKKSIKALEAFLKSEINTYEDAEEQRKIAALRTGDHTAALAMDTPTLSAGVQNRTLWKWRVINVQLIPSEFWALDASKIQTKVNACKSQTAIPGIEVYPETNIAAPSK